MKQMQSTRSGESGSTRSKASANWGALIGGGALAVLGLTQRSKLGLAMFAAGGTLAYMGMRQNGTPQTTTAYSSILVNGSPQDIYQFWKNFENLPIFMRHLDSVTIKSDKLSTWCVLGPGGTRICWDSEILNDRENQGYDWRSTPDSPVAVEGSVNFRPAPADRGTIVEVTMSYRPESQALARSLPKMLRDYSSFIMRQDLRRLKALIETGEIPTIEGQSHGPRSAITAAARMADPTQPIRRESRMANVFEAMRRIA